MTLFIVNCKPLFISYHISIFLKKFYYQSLFGRSYKENGNQSNDIIISNYVNHYET